MCFDTEVFQSDLKTICNAEYIPWDKLKGKTVLITGATGLIGYTLTCALLYSGRKRDLNLRVLALVRSTDKAKKLFAPLLEDGYNLHFLTGSVENLPKVSEPVDYIIHGASQTASKAFVNQPVETIKAAVLGTMSLLELAKSKKALGFVYLSSMEIYGFPKRGHKVSENEIGELSPLETRNCYPIGKIECESLCNAYSKEYGVPAMSVRLTQTFGPGVNYNDGRVFAEFGRCVSEKRDIVLKTKGETERCYLYTADAATAILAVLLKGEAGTSYNAADENTYCSIAQMADIVAKMGGVGVKYDITDGENNGYAKTLYMDLDTTRLKSLGFAPSFSQSADAHTGDDYTAEAMKYMYGRMIDTMIKGTD